MSLCPLTRDQDCIQANIEAWNQTRNFVRRIPITSLVNLSALKTVQTVDFCEFLLTEQLDSAKQYQTNTEENEIKTTLLFDETRSCGATSTRMKQGEIGSTPTGNENDGNDPNRQFFVDDQEHYYPEDELLSALVESCNPNPHLHLYDWYRLPVASQCHDNSITLLTAPDLQKPAPAQATTEHIRSKQFLSDPRIHNYLFCDISNISSAVLQLAAQQYEPEQVGQPVPYIRMNFAVIIEVYT